MIEIVNRYTRAVIYRAEEATDFKTAVEAAVKAEIDLYQADLIGARLDGASLDGARLDGASLDGARLDGASLDGARLVRARLDGARLDGARLDGASLVRASLDGASLDGASLDGIRDDLYEILNAAPGEALGLLSALRAGKVDGSTYSGECACLVGTIANVRKCTINELPGITPNSDRPAEIWFYAIRPGHTPANNEVSRVTDGWVVAWIRANLPEAATVLDADSALSSKLDGLSASRLALLATGDVAGIGALTERLG
jgi:hypothetical protein